MRHVSPRFFRTLGVAATVMATAVALSGCDAINVFGSAGKPERDSQTQEITRPGQADVFSIKVGDCLNEIPSQAVESVPVVPCGDPHDEEVFAEVTMTDKTWPGDDAIYDAAVEYCDAAFHEFVGVSWDDSELDWFPFLPTERGWSEIGDRLVQCVIYDPESKTTGSLKAAGR